MASNNSSNKFSSSTGSSSVWPSSMVLLSLAVIPNVVAAPECRTAVQAASNALLMVASAVPCAFPGREMFDPLSFVGEFRRFLLFSSSLSSSPAVKEGAAEDVVEEDVVEEDVVEEEVVALLSPLVPVDTAIVVVVD